MDMVINSHCHPDHVLGNHLLAGKALLVPRQRVEEVGAIHRLAQRLVGPDRKIMDAWEFFVREDLGMRDYEPTGTFQHGEFLDFGGISLQAIHTPGHLEDHYCFLEPEENILLSFDLDLTGFGPFYGNPESDIPRLKDSLTEIMDIKPRVMASSHRLPVRENIQDEIGIFADKISRNENRISAVLTIPLTLEEICARKPIYGKYLPGQEIIYSFFERCMIQKHLECMKRGGRVRFDEGKFHIKDPR